ncbi:hypothetical protein M3Y99_01777000 [Aphelenchoides fujianensis]|nr:hypothetical protein M3Y99_01777000 [Aphelenchoides fujianensis]
MLSSGLNETDTDCFQQCNDEWKREFEREFKLNCTDFYDFPFHPAILQYSGYLKYCELADKQTRCFVEQCNDEAADRVFSPSNFLCHFKRSVFLTARPCLESTEPLNFLKCDRYCHLKAKEAAKHVPKRAHLGKNLREFSLKSKVSSRRMNSPTTRPNWICSCRFQECYRECHREVVEESCAPALAAMTVDLVQSFIQSHAMEVYDWHLASKRLMPDSCLKLTGYKPEDDAILKIMSDIS